MFKPTIKVKDASQIPDVMKSCQRGQWIDLNGVRGRWIGVSRAGVIWICWVKGGRAPFAVQSMARAFRRFN